MVIWLYVTIKIRSFRHIPWYPIFVFSLGLSSLIKKTFRVSMYSKLRLATNISTFSSVTLEGMQVLKHKFTLCYVFFRFYIRCRRVWSSEQFNFVRGFECFPERKYKWVLLFFKWSSKYDTSTNMLQNFWQTDVYWFWYLQIDLIISSTAMFL